MGDTNGQCSGEHRYYVADVAVVEAEGKVVPIVICTACGKCISHEVQVTTNRNAVTLLKGEKQ